MRSTVACMTHASPAADAWSREQHRLTGIAYRMLGDYGLAEDVVSEVALAAVRAEREGTVRIWPAWLTTVCVRRSIDRLRQVVSTREDYAGPWLPEPVATDRLPEEVVADRELLSIALLHMAEQLRPEARAALVLHRAMGMSAVEIAEILQRSPAAVRQLISRAERRLRIDSRASIPPAATPAVLAELVQAIETGEIDQILHLLTDDAILWTDGGGRVRAALNPIYGGERIARFMAGVFAKATAGSPPPLVSVTVLDVNGESVLDVRLGPRRDLVAVDLDSAGRIRAIRQIANPDKLARVPV